MVTCETRASSSELLRLRTVPSIHLSEIGNVRRYCDSEVVMGGDIVDGDESTLQLYSYWYEGTWQWSWR